ncbi:MAG: hypothetical protein ACLU8F_00720 [Clostridia bacterium]
MELKKALWENFRNQYRICIDEEGRPKACGHDACKDLIHICNSIEGLKDDNPKYGNMDNGFMQVKNIMELAEKYCIIAENN